MRRAFIAVAIAVAVMLMSFVPGALLAALLEVGSPSSVREIAHELLVEHRAHPVHSARTPHYENHS